MNPTNHSYSLEQEPLRTRDVKKVTGISDRQLTDWDKKMAVQSSRKSKSGWRTFSSSQVFFLIIGKEIRDNYGIPIESLGFIKSMMLQGGADYFRYATEMIRNYGFTIYLLTDLRTTFIMDTDLEFQDMFRLGFFRGDASKNFIFIKINPLVNRMLELKGLPPLQTSNKTSEILQEEMFSRAKLDKQETELLALIRKNDYQRITVHLKGGQIMQADVEEDSDEATREKFNKQICKVIESKKFQTIVAQIHDGEIMRLSRKTPIKFKETTERT